MTFCANGKKADSSGGRLNKATGMNTRDWIVYWTQGLSYIGFLIVLYHQAQQNYLWGIPFFLATPLGIVLQVMLWVFIRDAVRARRSRAGK